MSFDRREYIRSYQREWIARRRAAWFAGKQCAGCGTTEGLELHHRESEEKITHRIWSWSRERREAELAKCEARCSACHLEAHGKLHGTTARYEAGCRCTCCVENLPVLSSERGVRMSRAGVEVSGCAVGSRAVLPASERP